MVWEIWKSKWLNFSTWWNVKAQEDDEMSDGEEPPISEDINDIKSTVNYVIAPNKGIV